MDEEEAVTFLFATAAFTTFFAAAALVRCTDSPWTSCRSSVLPGRIGSLQLACRQDMPFSRGRRVVGLDLFLGRLLDHILNKGDSVLMPLASPADPTH